MKVEGIKDVWTRGRGATDKLRRLSQLQQQHRQLLKRAEGGDEKAYQEANRLAIRIRSVEDRLQGKAAKVLDLYETYYVVSTEFVSE